MKTPKEWFEEELSGEPLTQESVIEVIKMIQEEVIEETVKLCADVADADFNIINDQFNITSDDIEVYVLKNSILNCVNILKQQL